MVTKESQIEQRLIDKLQDLKYDYREDIRTQDALEANFKKKFEELNKVNLTDSEFTRLREKIISADVFAAAKILRETNSFERDDGTPLHYTLVNIKDWCKNSFEVINQLRIDTEKSFHRYDVILLINGVPIVQIELKTLDVSPSRAMQQIVDYKNDAGNSYTSTLLCFMQLFIVSNESKTRYFANNHNKHFSFDADERFLPVYECAKEDNSKVNNLYNFSELFLSKCTLGEMISRYMVMVESEQKLMIMRPYQIYAVKAIVDCIQQNRGNGYIWHTTGSGKTLTSFKASTLLKDNNDIKKCLFVVDRKDLDRQTREEFNKFQEGCVEENTNTKSMVKRMLSTNYADKVIVTTIQKLGLALDGTNKQKYKEKLEPLRNERIVFIFDECHRSQFGENHKAIKEFFPNAQLFGFTGTPIFEKNATYQQIEGDVASLKTTKDIFQKELHAYTITNAIDDKNVLGFHIDYYKGDDKNKSKTKRVKKVKASDGVSQEAVVNAILEKHTSATAKGKFNAILASATINHAIEYHRLFKEIQEQQQEDDINFTPLNIACVFSPPAKALKNKDKAKNDKNIADIKQLQEDLPQEKADNEIEPNKKKKALTAIIGDYNTQYSTNFDINQFDLYYQDVQARIKNQQYPNRDYPHSNKIDIVIVVEMLLTGFDAKYLNTLYVDRNLKYHGLIQAFSRTNRVLNDTKPWGNILDFRGQQDEVDEAIKLFSGKHADRAKEVWLVDSAPKVINKLEAAVDNFEQFMQSQGLEPKPEQVNNLKGNQARSQFINVFKEVQRLKTQLDQYTDLKPDESKKIEKIIPEDQLRAFKSMYLDTAERLRALQNKGGDASGAEGQIQQLDFEFVLFASAEIDYDYIMGLIASYTQSEPEKQKMTREQLIDLIASTSNLMDERDEIKAYIESLKAGEALNEKEIRQGYETFKTQKLDNEMAEVAKKFGLETKALQAFSGTILNRMIFDGEQLGDLLAPLDLGWKERTEKELALMDKLVPLLNKLSKGQKISGLEAYE